MHPSFALLMRVCSSLNANYLSKHNMQNQYMSVLFNSKLALKDQVRLQTHWMHNPVFNRRRRLMRLQSKLLMHCWGRDKQSQQGQNTRHGPSSLASQTCLSNNLSLLSKTNTHTHTHTPKARRLTSFSSRQSVANMRAVCCAPPAGPWSFSCHEEASATRCCASLRSRLRKWLCLKGEAFLVNQSLNRVS